MPLAARAREPPSTNYVISCTYNIIYEMLAMTSCTMSYIYHIIHIFHMKYNLKSYIMSYVNEVLDESKMMSYVYDVIYDVMCIRHHVWCMISYMISSLIQPGSNAPPGRFKCGPWPVHMQSYLNQMLALLVPFVCLSVLASKSGCSGLLLHIWRLVLNSLAPSPPLPHPHRPLHLAPPRSMPV